MEVIKDTIQFIPNLGYGIMNSSCNAHSRQSNKAPEKKYYLLENLYNPIYYSNLIYNTY